MRESSRWTFPSIEFVYALRFLPPGVQMGVRDHPVFFPSPVYQEVPVFAQHPTQQIPPLINYAGAPTSPTHGNAIQPTHTPDMPHPPTPLLAPVDLPELRPVSPLDLGERLVPIVEEDITAELPRDHDYDEPNGGIGGSPRARPYSKRGSKRKANVVARLILQVPDELERSAEPSQSQVAKA
ncbi:hypothetical protein SISNIDRAFT_461732 [Sistotremastrum niveocremeum HHB9708]|uniref:Uncharacterized protein n=1 Tax=Sistotremastrum niveocremeum HHB9708 TaxID=1314777 RepID=A0A165ABN6_9AGAM|nr:hypothetical protein SISNIDRAFT_461732 [Sistotremastrum niveocremeum HHB9708]